MTSIIIGLTKKLLGYVAVKLAKPEVLVELILDLVDTAVARTDTKYDDKVAKDIRKALGHEEK